MKRQSSWILTLNQKECLRKWTKTCNQWNCRKKDQWLRTTLTILQGSFCSLSFVYVGIENSFFLISELKQDLHKNLSPSTHTHTHKQQEKSWKKPDGWGWFGTSAATWQHSLFFASSQAIRRKTNQWPWGFTTSMNNPYIACLYMLRKCLLYLTKNLAIHDEEYVHT